MLGGGDESAEEALFSSDDDEVLRDIAHRRMQAMKEASLVPSYGFLQACQHEREILSSTADLFGTGSKLCATTLAVILIHFTNPAFEKCQKMTELLTVAARAKPAWRIMQVPAQEAPFLVTRLSIRVLPCVVVIRGAALVDRILGFDGIGEADKPETWTPSALLKRISESLSRE